MFVMEAGLAFPLSSLPRHDMRRRRVELTETKSVARGPYLELGSNRRTGGRQTRSSYSSTRDPSIHQNLLKYVVPYLRGVNIDDAMTLM